MERDEMAQGLRLTAIAVVSAVMTATLVIGVGQTWLARQAPTPPAGLIQTSG